MANDAQGLDARLKGMAFIVKFGHDLFNAANFTDASLMAVNNTIMLLKFKSSSLVEICHGRSDVVAQYGQPVINKTSRLAVLLSDLCRGLKFDSETLTMAKDNGLPEELASGNSVYYAVKLKASRTTPDHGLTLIWLLEYENEIPEFAKATVTLLASSMGEALFHHKLCEVSDKWRISRRFQKKHIAAGLIVFALLLLLFIRVPERAKAEFTLQAPEITSVYAWFDGVIAKCHKQDGDTINKGEIIAEYDTSQIAYRLAAAQSAVRETETELELEQRAAFSERERLGRIKLLEAKLDSAKVAVSEAEWFLSHSKLTAPASGVLSLSDGRAELLTGKAVRTGNRIFEIYGGNGMVAEIQVNERESSILPGKPDVSLFLYTAPDVPVAGKIIDINSYPEMSEQRTYCYKVRADVSGNIKNMRYGMRGIAILKNSTVSLGYALFKSCVIYFRGL